MNTIGDIGIAYVIFCGLILVYCFVKNFFFPNKDND